MIGYTNRILDNHVKLSYNDVSVVPAPLSYITSRSQCYLTNSDEEKDSKYLPIFTAPMTSVVDETNIDIYDKNGIIPIYPRKKETQDSYKNKPGNNPTLDLLLSDNNKFVAVSLKFFKYWFVENPNILLDSSVKKFKVLIDVANGHMKVLYDYISKAKDIFGQRLIIMTGNIANPLTYLYAWKSGVDYIRLGIGSGFGCITSSNCGCHYGMISLISETATYRDMIQWALDTCKNKINWGTLYTDLQYKTYVPQVLREAFKNYLNGKDSINKFDEAMFLDSEILYGETGTNPLQLNDFKYINAPKIIADGGIRNFDHVIIALAAGADYVMIGGLFSSCLESCAKNYIKTENSEYRLATEKDIQDILNGNTNKSLYKKFYGMASKEGQLDLNGKKIHTSEGISKFVKVQYHLKQWCDNMRDYLRSCMSYTNCENLYQFRNSVRLVRESEQTIKSINK